jgi:hypothetical protein
VVVVRLLEDGSLFSLSVAFEAMDIFKTFCSSSQNQARLLFKADWPFLTFATETVLKHFFS